MLTRLTLCLVELALAALLALRTPLARRRDALAGGRRCRVCGCTESACCAMDVAPDYPCWWVEPDLCSACRMLEVGQ